jgi:arabinose-5-phosphate isomerase
MLSELFKKQQGYIAQFFSKVDLTQAEKILAELAACRGNILFTGIGKSGFIAEKLAMTMISTGTKAFYLPPTNALHGDLGIIGPEDLLVLISKSGESDELLQLLPFVKLRGAKTMAWVCKEGSRLFAASDLGMVLPLVQELCPFGLSPTTSSVLQLIFGDIIAVALMQTKQFSLDQYALNHPAGLIGKQISLKVKDLMLTGDRLPLCFEEDRLQDVLHELSNKRCGCLLVLNRDREFVGIFTDGDLRRALERGGRESLEEPIASWMTISYRATHPEELALEALQLMEGGEGRRVMMLPVVEEGALVGLIHLHDILQTGISVS